jgi:peptidoglycan-associated lipoprotein
MKKKICLAVALGVLLIIVLFMASCSKQVAKTQMEPIAAPAPAAEPQALKATPETSEGKDEMAGPVDKDRLRETEASARDAEEVFVNENVHFSFNSALLSNHARQVLKDKAGFLRTNPDITLTIEGHCDDRGTNIYNLALGELRAVSVKKYLVALGIGPERLDTVTYGEERPIAMGHDEASWAMNRRAQFVIN